MLTVFQIKYRHVLCLPLLMSLVMPCHPDGGAVTTLSDLSNWTSRTLVREFGLYVGTMYRNLRSPRCAPLARSSNARSAIVWVETSNEQAAELDSVVNSGTSHTNLRIGRSMIRHQRDSFNDVLSTKLVIDIGAFPVELEDGVLWHV